jgi:AcrR family transcriptional regulator
VLHAALELFAEHGVGGTSLQMIADRLGVTKAAVYHQFPTKDEIILAVVQPATDRIAAIFVTADAEPQPGRRRAMVVEALIDLVLDHRRLMAALHGDPGLTEALVRHPALTADIDRLQQLLFGPAPSLSDVIAGAMFGGGLMGIGADPRLAGSDRASLRTELLAVARRLLQL